MERTQSRTGGFHGPAGRLAGPVMARMNRDMERAAVAELAPRPDDAVLAVGFGPGVGIAELVRHLPDGVIGGVDPSEAMLQQARRRNASAIASGQVLLESGTAARIPWPDATFSGVVAVNSMQLWDPLDASLQEVARVLAPGGLLVTVTHVWAIEKHSSLDDGVDVISAALENHGFADRAMRTAPFRSGSGLLLRAHAPSLQPDRTPTAAP
jgi:ubiquinone/menaquinone biosynthesis C-methylase UbiE